MATLFQARCECCSYSSELFLSEYGAVFVDSPPPDTVNTVIAGVGLYVLTIDAGIAEQGEPQLVVLAHPIEEYILAQIGYTWSKLAWAGRYLGIRRVICRSCGLLFDVRKLTCPLAFGTPIGCVLGIGVGIGIGFWKRSFSLGLSTFFGVYLGWLTVANTAGWLYIRLRFSERARVLDGPHCCPNCGTCRYESVESIGSGRTFPCPECGAQALRIISFGVS